MPSDNVELLEFPTSVQIRPNMYVGDLDDASVLLREAVDNSIDELYSGMEHHIKGMCNKIWVESGNGAFLVADNGRGIPIKESSEEGVTMARLAVSHLSAGSKFKKNSIAIGMNGVGISCVNALSTSFAIRSRLNLHDINDLPKDLRKRVPKDITDNTYYYCKFENGYLKDEGFEEFSNPAFKGEHPSTITTFSPSSKYYHSIKARIPSSLQYVKFILDKSNHPSEIYINGEPFKDAYKGFGFDLDCTIPSAEDGAKNPNLRMIISVGFQDKLDPCQVVGSVNGLDCRAGFHIKLAQIALDKAFTRLFSNCNRTEFMGMNIGVVCLCNEPEFSSQTKERMSGADGFRCTERDGKHEIDILTKACMNMMKAHFDEFKLHEAKILEYMKSTEKIGRKELIKSSVLIAANTSRPEAFIPNKLLDCSTTNRQEAELVVCEGQSAAGSLIKCRDPRIHAILPLRG